SASVASPSSPSSTISRAARRTSAERRSPSSLWPSINAFKRSRVRSDAGILPIGVLLRQRSVAKPDLVDSPIRRRCTPTLFPAILGLHLARQMFQEILRLIAELRPQPPPALT